MASGTKVRGITIELGADTTGIGKALSGLNSQINSTQKQLKDVEKLLKFDPKNTELLKQKQELLNKAITDSKAKVEALKEAQAQLGERTEENAKQYDAIEREIISCTSEQKKWQDALDEMTPKAKTLKETLSEVSEATGKAAEKTKGLSAAAAGLGAGLLGNAYKAAQTADDINTLSKQYGIAVEEIQKMRYAQDTIDVSTETMLASYAKLTKQMGANNATFEELGVAITDTNGELRDSEDVWYDTLEALSLVENETLRDVYAQEIFGKSAADLAGVIDDGGEALRQMGQEAENAGLILSGDALADANEFNDAIDKLKATASASFLEAGAALATTLVPALEKLVEVVSNVLIWFGNLDGTTQTVILTVLALVAAISPVLGLISTLTGLAAGLNVAMLPMIGTIGAVIAIMGALVAAGVYLYQNWDTVKAKASELYTSVSNKFNSIKTAITNAINGARDAVSNAVNRIKSIMNFSWRLPHLALPHFSISGGFSLYPPSVPHIGVSWYKKAMQNGMILNNPTIFGAMNGKLLGAGEAGAEVVVGASSLENMIAKAVGAGGTNINVTVNGAVGQDVNELADLVAVKINNAVARKANTWR